MGGGHGGRSAPSRSRLGRTTGSKLPLLGFLMEAFGAAARKLMKMTMGMIPRGCKETENSSTATGAAEEERNIISALIIQLF